MLEGEATFIFQQAEKQSQIRLQNSGEYLIVPRNTWHTAKIKDSAKLLFITPGEGTENKPI